MIIEIGAAALLRPIVIDTDAKPGTLAGLIKPSVVFRLGPGGAPIASYNPHGAASGGPESFILIAVVALVLAFAAVGVAKSL